MRSVRSFLPALSTCALLLTSCSGTDDDGLADGDAQAPNLPGPPSTACKTSLALRPQAPVADARARAALPIAIDVGDDGGMTGPRPIKIVLSRDGSPIATLFDGAHALGKLDVELAASVTADLATGRYTLDATAGCPAGATSETAASATAPLFLVRLGVTSIDVGDGDGARVPLMYHAVDRQYENLYPIGKAIAATLAIPTGEAEIDGPNGAPRAFANPWDDLDSPPVDGSGAVVEEGVTFPVSLRVGTKPDLVLRIAKTAFGKGGPQSTGLDAEGVPAVRLVVDGTTASTPSVALPGESVTVRLATSPVPAIARVDHSLHWHFEAKNADETWSTILGADGSATLRLYGVLGNTQGAAAPNLPWVAVVDDATRAIGGEAANAEGARAALVRHVYEKMGLTYDRVQGASHYTRDRNFGGGAQFKLARFLARDFGNIVNCSDCASILSTYANMIGAELKYAIIESDFALHPILGIGASEFGSPFNSGRMGFSYHAVTSPDATGTIYDATLAVDGDTNPAEAPFTKRLVQGIPGAEYLERLSGDPRAEYTDVSKSTLVDF